jgi:hypothetical protein
MHALYDLADRDRRCPVTFDSYVWFTLIKMLGYDHVVFSNTDRIRTKKYPGGEEEARKRFETIVWPGPQFYGMGRSLGTDGDRVGTCNIRDLINEGYDISGPRLQSIRPSGISAPYTVTLRQMSKKPERNSEDVWREFAARINAYVIEDWFVQHIALEDRVAVYAGSKMNYGVMGGPMAMLLWSPYPLSAWCDPGIESLTKSMDGHGMKPDGQWPFQLPNQRLVWKKPTLDALLEEHAKWTS